MICQYDGNQCSEDVITVNR